MKVLPTSLPGVLILEPEMFADNRGDLMEAYSMRRYLQLAGIDLPFVQDNVSRSHRSVLRGLHFQRKKPQGKLIQVLAGSIFDVVADINPQSRNYGSHTTTELSADNHRQLWIPPGYAHGFCVTSDTAIVHYKCTEYYDPEDQAGVAWNCPRLGIPWPVKTPVLSDKDRLLQSLPG